MSCPICGKPTVQAARPFCSKRCADLDLARWLGEGYRIAGAPEEDEGLPEGSLGKERNDLPH